MSDELKLKPPKTIYLQWDEDPLAENTWCETPINDDDIKYVRPVITCPGCQWYGANHCNLHNIDAPNGCEEWQTKEEEE